VKILDTYIIVRGYADQLQTGYLRLGRREAPGVNREDVTYNVSTILPIPEGWFSAECEMASMETRLTSTGQPESSDLEPSAPRPVDAPS
jgi:hypothetical protein